MADRIFLTGGTGFVGSALRDALRGRRLRLLVRDPAKHAGLDSERVELATGDVTDPESLRGAMDDCDAVIHLVAIIAERGGTTFDGVIRQGTVNVLEEAKRADVGRFLHMSALGARDAPAFPYLHAKHQSEQAVREEGIPWTIFRPSVIFGPHDEFINKLAGVVRSFPLIPVVGDGRSLFQPVSVRDVADAYVRAFDDPRASSEIYELDGPEVFTYEEMLDVIAGHLGKRKRKVHVPVGLMKVAVSLSRPLPAKLRPPVTTEQLKMLALDNATERSATAELIGRAPLSLRDGIGYIRP
jgi:NADH dehydrogenase